MASPDPESFTYGKKESRLEICVFGSGIWSAGEKLYIYAGALSLAIESGGVWVRVPIKTVCLSEVPGGEGHGDLKLFEPNVPSSRTQ